MKFAQLFSAWDWKPIRNCPGRYVLQGARVDLNVSELIAGGPEAIEFHVKAARDSVLVVKLDDGGIISYKRKDGSHLHTLNTEEGFRRKLAQLGIWLRDETE